jgi:hypothetical protein
MQWSAPALKVGCARKPSGGVGFAGAEEVQARIVASANAKASVNKMSQLKDSQRLFASTRPTCEPLAMKTRME